MNDELSLLQRYMKQYLMASMTTCATSTTTGSNAASCLGHVYTTTNAALPPLVRNDRETYLTKRLGLPPLPDYLDNLYYNNDEEERRLNQSTIRSRSHSRGSLGDSHLSDVNDPESLTTNKDNDNRDIDNSRVDKAKVPKAWTKRQSINNNHLPFTTDYDFTCRLIMAPSSIPNSGFGVFAGEDIPPNTYVDLNPQLLLPLMDINYHTRIIPPINDNSDDSNEDVDDDATSATTSHSATSAKPWYRQSFLSDYVWSSDTYGAHLESYDGATLYTTLGMLANSHLELANTYQRTQRRPNYSRIQNRNVNPGTGSYSNLDGISFMSKDDEKNNDSNKQKGGIQQGNEIFVFYGINWFHAREEKMDTLFPTSNDYRIADEIVRIEQWDGNKETIEQSQKKWDDILTKLQLGTLNLNREHTEEERKSQLRIASALPSNIQDTNYVAKIGTAKYSVPNSRKSISTLKKEGGECLDLLRKGKSNIAQAGFGAFALYNMEEGSIIAPAPLVPFQRKVLDMEIDARTHQPVNPTTTMSNDTIKTSQLILNYSFGHPDSTLLLFPYASSINYINHNNINPNAYIRLSPSKMNRNELLEKPINELYSGLIFEVVALREISFGEEITIDYGKEWTDAWNQHVHQWKIQHEQHIMNPQSTIEEYMSSEEMKKKPYRTIDEQKIHPYPECIRTACYSIRNSGMWKYENFSDDYMSFCSIVERKKQNELYFYSVLVGRHSIDEEKNFNIENIDDNKLLKMIPQQAMFLLHDQYCSDLHLNGFRHEVGVPEGLYPDLWMDLEEETKPAKN